VEQQGRHVDRRERWPQVGFGGDVTRRSILKRELAWIHATKHWSTREQLRTALFDYIEGFYNPQRIQQRLGHRSPVDYEQHTAA
jgi:transposase InsO family protein